MIDKNYCMSSYLAFRYIEADNVDFKDGLRHKNFVPIADDKKVVCNNSNDIDADIEKQFAELRQKHQKLGIMLSGGFGFLHDGL